MKKLPEWAEKAGCHTFDDGESLPLICLATDCPARPLLSIPNNNQQGETTT